MTRSAWAWLAGAVVVTACEPRAADADARSAMPPVVASPVVTDVGIVPPAPLDSEAYADTLHGVVVPDPYRFLEDTRAERTRRWVAGQERYAAQVLARGVAIDSLTARYAAALRDAPTLERIGAAPGRLLLTRWLGDSPTLFLADSTGGNERPLRAADAVRRLLRGGSVREVVPSPDGGLLAIGATKQGDAGATILLLDGETGALLADRVPDLFTTTSGTRYQVSWLPTESATAPAFFYPRLWPGSQSGPTGERLSRGRIFLHRVGTPQAQDRAVFGFGVSAQVPMAPDDVATRVLAAPGSRWLIGSVYRSRQNGREDYVAPRTPGDTSVPAWTPLLALSDRAAYPQLLGDTAYALLRGDADRGRIARRVLGAGARPAGAWTTVVPERRGVITAFAVRADGLYFIERAGGALTLFVLPPGAKDARAIPLPAPGTVRFAPQSGAASGVLVMVDSWATPPRWTRVTEGGAVVTPLSVDDGARAPAPATMVSDRLEARSADGTMVPVSIVYDRAALRTGTLDGTAPLLIEAYGGFGQATDPSYDPTIQVWTSLGGVYAYAHVRGGGELGEAWHQAAVREKKGRSVDDLIGAVEALIARRFTSVGRVATQGVSWGAGVAALAPLARPDLFGAVLFDVGGPDEVRGAALDPSAARNIAEIGDTETPGGVRSLVAASPYHRIPARYPAPAMLLHSASDDYNFGTEMLVGKFVARLQAANAGTRPIVWVRTPGGHRWLRSLSPEWAARQAAFLLWQLGDPRHQPAAPDRLTPSRSLQPPADSLQR